MQIRRTGSRCWTIAPKSRRALQESAESGVRVKVAGPESCRQGPYPPRLRSCFTLYLDTMSGEDDDIKLQRASSALLSDLEKLLPKLIRGHRNGPHTSAIRQYVREADMYRVCALVRYIVRIIRAPVDLRNRLSLFKKIPSFLMRT